MPLLQKDSKGDDVKKIQAALKKRGIYSGPIDGDFGIGTDKAVRKFQESSGLIVDGIVGPSTMKMILNEQKHPVEIKENPYYQNLGLSLKKGDNGPEVRALQEDMIRLGFLSGKADGDFGPKTGAAVERFLAKTFKPDLVEFDLASLIHRKTGLTSSDELDIDFIASPNKSSRKGRKIDMLVVHFTANGSVDATVNWFENPTANASAHYILGRDGNIVQMVHEEEKAWHAGKSAWEGVPSCNNYSIGIEIVNWGEIRKRDGKYYCWPRSWGREYNGSPSPADGTFWEIYTNEQYDMLAALTRKILSNNDISLDRIVGHSDIAPGRKTDPGPVFDWNRYKSLL